MSKAPRLQARQVEKALRRLGFEAVRQSGSHRIMRDAAGHRVTLPIHPGQVLHPRVLKSIVEQAGTTMSRLRRLL